MTARTCAVVIALLTSCLTLAGCAGLPTSSTVNAGQAVNAQPDSEPLTVEPLTASSFDDPRGIATGFIRAQMSSLNGYSAARTFLTSQASAKWSPGAAVTIFDGDSDITATRPETGTIRLVVPVVGTISADGHLSRSQSPTRRTIDVHVTHTAQGWRVSEVPTGSSVWMSDTDVARLYTPSTVYYPSAYGRSLVPDPRWLPRQGLATALARAALTAPPAWLAPAVSTRLPRGSALAVDAVPVKNGVAEVSLSPGTAAADNTARSALWASMAATVVQAPEVRAVTLKIGGARLETENLPATVDDPTQVGYTLTTGVIGSVLSRSGTYLAWTTANAPDAVSGTTKQAAAGKPKLPAVPATWSMLVAGQGGRQIAAISADRTSVRRWVNGTDVTITSMGTGLVRPAFDTAGWLWIAGHAFSNDPRGGAAKAGEFSSSLWVVDTDTGSAAHPNTTVAVPWLGSDSIESVSISPEGARILLTVRHGDSQRAVVAAIVRDASGKPIRLGTAHDVATEVSGVRDAVWADASSLAVLGTVDGTQQPALVPIDDVATALGPVAGQSSLVSSLNGANGLFVETDSDTVMTRLGSSWSSFLSHGELLAPAG